MNVRTSEQIRTSLVWRKPDVPCSGFVGMRDQGSDDCGMQDRHEYTPPSSPCRLLLHPDVINVEQARIAEEAGAVAVMALERIPADIRADGGVARMSDPKMIKEIKNAVSIPVMAKVRICMPARVCLNIVVE